MTDNPLGAVLAPMGALLAPRHEDCLQNVHERQFRGLVNAF